MFVRQATGSTCPRLRPQTLSILRTVRCCSISMFVVVASLKPRVHYISIPLVRPEQKNSMVLIKPLQASQVSIQAQCRACMASAKSLNASCISWWLVRQGRLYCCLATAIACNSAVKRLKNTCTSCPGTAAVRRSRQVKSGLRKVRQPPGQPAFQRGRLAILVGASELMRATVNASP